MEQINEIPEIEFGGRTWLVDVEGFQLIDKADRANTLSFTNMRYTDIGYFFSYATMERSIVDKSAMEDEKFDYLIESGTLYEVYLPPLSVLDPEGVGRRYGIDSKDVESKYDAQIMLDRTEMLHGQRIQGALLDITVFAAKAVDEKSPIEMPMVEFMVRKFITARDLLLENPVLEEELRQTRPEIFSLMDNLSVEFIESANEFVKGENSIENEVLSESFVFGFDFENFRIFEVDNPENTIEVSKMEDMGWGYRFLFDPLTKNIAESPTANRDLVQIDLGYFTVINPQKLAEIYNVPIEFVKCKSDREFKRDLQELQQKREQSQKKSQTRKRGYKR